METHNDIQKPDRRNFKKRYFFMAVILLGLALWFAALPEPYNNKELKPENLLLEVMDNTRYLSTDDVAHMMISNDYILLVDVRSEAEYNKYHLPGAINIPATDILSKDEDGEMKWGNIFNQDVRKVIMYSNGSIYSSQAWILLRRLNLRNNYVMKGGLNEWFATIILPKKPSPEASDDEFARYNTRKAAGLHFTGGGTVSGGSSDAEPEEVPLIMDNSAPKEEEGGC